MPRVLGAFTGSWHIHCAPASQGASLSFRSDQVWRRSAPRRGVAGGGACPLWRERFVFIGPKRRVPSSSMGPRKPLPALP